MERTLQVLNELERDGVIRRYAIGGAMAAVFYMEPLLTYDLDVFVLLPPATGELLSLAPLYECLKGRGYPEEGECVNIEGVPVQFLPAYNRLVEEALQKAEETKYEQTTTRVLRAEHLAAIMLQTGRAKDRQRLAAFLQEAPHDRLALQDIVRRHGLEELWREWVG